VTALDFVKAWETSKTTKEVADKTGTTYKKASIRAMYLRKKGVKLKKFGTRQRLDIAELEKFRLSLKSKE
jgi:hypothetical protein